MESVGIRELRANLAAAARRAGEMRPRAARSWIVGSLSVGSTGPSWATGSPSTVITTRSPAPARRADRPTPGFAMPMWAGTRIDQLAREIRGR